MTERLEIYLTGCQLGITTSSILLGVVAEPAVTALLEPLMSWLGVGAGSQHWISIVVAVIIINLVHKIYGEQAPTYLGVERPLYVAQRLAPALYWWVKATAPVIYLGDGLAKASLRLFGIEITRSWTQDGQEGERITTYGELRRQMRELLSGDVLADDRREEVIRALEIERMPVERIMIPRAELVTLSTAKGIEENLHIIGEHAFVRFPLTDEGGQRYLGLIYVPALFRHLAEIRAGTLDLREVATPALTVPAEQPVSQVIDTLQAANQEAALVERNGEVVGFVTVTDTFEAIAGQIEDPFD